MAPAWGGVLGGALTEAATSYLDALLKAPDEAVARRKRDLENQRIESQIALDQAHVDYYRRPDRGLAPIIRVGADGIPRLVDRRDPLSGGIALPGFPERTAKPLLPLQKWDQDTMTQIEREVGHPPPYSYEELSQERVAPLVDMLKTPRIYGGPTGYTTAEEIRDAFRTGQPVREKQGVTGQQPTQPPPATSQPTQPSATSQPAPAPAPPPAPTQRPSAQPGAASPPPGPGTTTTGNAYIAHYRTLDRAAILADLKEALTRDPGGQSRDTQLRVAAQANVLLKRGEQPILPDEVKGTAAPAPAAETPPPSAPAAISRGGTVKTVETEGQKRDREIREEEQRRKNDAADRALTEQERRDRRELSGPVSPDQARLANDYFARGVPGFDTQYFPLLGEAQKKQINDDIQKPILEKRQREAEIFQGKLRKEHSDALHRAEPYIHELRAIDTTRELTEMILPLVRKGTIGIGGQATTLSNVLASWLPGYKSQFQKQAEKQLREEGYEGAITKAAVDARIAAMVEGNAKELQYDAMFSPAASKLEVLSSILAYLHALTVKRTATGPSGRSGITVQDLKAAHEWFDPRLWKTSPDVILARLEGLQEYIQKARPSVEQMITDFHIDPKTHKLLPYNPVTAPLLEQPQAPVVQPTPDDVDVMRGGR